MSLRYLDLLFKDCVLKLLATLSNNSQIGLNEPAGLSVRTPVFHNLHANTNKQCGLTVSNECLTVAASVFIFHVKPLYSSEVPGPRCVWHGARNTCNVDKEEKQK